MGYWHDIFIIRGVREHEYKFAGNYGKKGEKRQKKEKPTPEQMELYNRINKAKKIRRTIALNFKEMDYWISLTYEKNTQKDIQQVKSDVKKLVDKLRHEYKKRGAVLLWMEIVEIGKRGGLHAHIVLNRIADTDMMVAKYWEHGHPYFKPLYEEGQYEELASYMAKLPPEEDEKHPEKSRQERMEKITKENYYFSSSRNLIRPEPAEHHRYFRRTVERIIRNGPKPEPGYYIDKSSIKTGVNKVTGLSYLYYMEYPLQQEPQGHRRI